MTATTLIPVEQAPQNEMMFIYVLRCRVNGKLYVGQDGGFIGNLVRVKAHFSDARSVAAGKQHRCESKLIPALIKHGFDTFEVFIHSWGHSNKKAIDTAEIAAIAELDAIKNGYNIRPGGQGFPPNHLLSDEDQLKMREIRRRGSQIGNRKRWDAVPPQDRLAHMRVLKLREHGPWRQSLQNYWDAITPEQRIERGRQMSEGVK